MEAVQNVSDAAQRDFQRVWFLYPRTTKSAVGIRLNKFRTLGFISYNGTLEIRRSLFSVVLPNQPQIKKKINVSRRPTRPYNARARSDEDLTASWIEVKQLLTAL